MNQSSKRDWATLRWTTYSILIPTIIYSLFKTFDVYFGKKDSSNFFIILFRNLFIGDTVLFGTLMAILVYTWKTWQLKDLTAKEITYEIRPLVILGSQMFIKNIANGIAREIEIEKIQIRTIPRFIEYFKVKGNESNLEFVAFDMLDYLTKEEKDGKRIQIKGLDCTGKETPIPTTIYNGLCGDLDGIQGISITIKYKDVEGKQYKSKMAVKDGRLQLISIE